MDRPDNRRWPAFLLFGMPGSGKGTQGTTLGNIPGYIHVASGDIFRSLNPKGRLGKEVSSFTSEGRLVPDPLTIQIWSNHMRILQTQNRFDPLGHRIICDGIPRTYEQARLLDEKLDVLMIFYMKLRTDEEAVDRIRGRALQQNRIDDANEDVIRDRLRVFREQTASTLEFYDPSLVVEIDASQPPMFVLRDLVQQICNVVPEAMNTPAGR